MWWKWRPLPSKNCVRSSCVDGRLGTSLGSWRNSGNKLRDLSFSQGKVKVGRLIISVWRHSRSYSQIFHTLSFTPPENPLFGFLNNLLMISDAPDIQTFDALEKRRLIGRIPATWTSEQPQKRVNIHSVFTYVPVHHSSWINWQFSNELFDGELSHYSINQRQQHIKTCVY